MRHAAGPIALAAALALATAAPAWAQDTQTDTQADTEAQQPDTQAQQQSDTQAQQPDTGTQQAETGTQAQDGAPDEAVREAARRYIESEGMQAMMDEMLSPDAMADALRAQFGEQIPEDVMSQIVTIATDELQSIRPAMEDAMIEAAAETFTLEEIEAQIEFYQSPEGASVISKMQPFMTSFYEAIGPEFQATNERIMQRASETIPPQ